VSVKGDEMSKGPGRLQREILAAVASKGAVYLVDLLPEGYTLSQYKAMHRAATRLADAQLVGYWTFRCGAGRGQLARVVLTQPGAAKPDREALKP